MKYLVQDQRCMVWIWII